MFLNPANLNYFLEDSCDVIVIKQLKLALDTFEHDITIDQTFLLENLIRESECEYYTNKIYPSLNNDSAIWLMTIRPVLVGKDEIILGNLYTFDPHQDSTFVFLRRVKKYSQMEDFESGKYILFTYFVENDTTTTAKAGKRRY